MGHHAAVGQPAKPVRALPEQLLRILSTARSASAEQAARHVVAGHLVKVTGSAAPGPDGPLRAPLSGRECVWYRSIVFRQAPMTATGGGRLQPMSEFILSDLPGYGTTKRFGVFGERLGTDTRSATPILVSDGDCGVLIDPRRCDVDSNVFAINEIVVVERDGRDSKRISDRELHTEWIIPVGAQVLAVGTVGRDDSRATWLGTREHGAGGAGDVVYLTTKPEAQVVSRCKAGPMAKALTRRILVFGLSLGLVVAIALGQALYLSVH